MVGVCFAICIPMLSLFKLRKKKKTGEQKVEAGFAE